MELGFCFCAPLVVCGAAAAPEEAVCCGFGLERRGTDVSARAQETGSRGGPEKALRGSARGGRVRAPRSAGGAEGSARECASRKARMGVCEQNEAKGVDFARAPALACGPRRCPPGAGGRGYGYVPSASARSAAHRARCRAPMGAGETDKRRARNGSLCACCRSFGRARRGGLSVSQEGEATGVRKGETEAGEGLMCRSEELWGGEIRSWRADLDVCCF